MRQKRGPDQGELAKVNGHGTKICGNERRQVEREMMKDSQHKTTKILFFTAVILLGYQNCGSFQAASSSTATDAGVTGTSTTNGPWIPTLSGGSGSATGSAGSSTGSGSSSGTTTGSQAGASGSSATSTAPANYIIKSVSGTEMQPIELQFDNTVLANLTALPKGVIYNQTAKTFLWLPLKGQAGSYTIDFSTTTASTGLRLNVTLGAVSAATLAHGPSDGFQDGDVGYVFIHGAGSVDRCADHADLLSYWGTGPQLMARNANNSTLTCYDGRLAAETVAPSVAQQILAANCGRFNKCILITHSMGGLVAELMMTHTRAAQASDPEPALFTNAALYQQVKDRTLAVISIASAAGGSDVSTILQQPGDHAAIQAIVAQIEDWMGSNTPSTQSVAVARASDILAPYQEDPGVPIFMIGGYSPHTVWEREGILGGIYNDIVNEVPLDVYDANKQLAALDEIVQDSSRSDGLVDFRSSCGVMSDNYGDGPGYKASLAQQFTYCATAPKKLNHYTWFLSSMNHFLISSPWDQCHNADNPCITREPDLVNSTFTQNAKYNYLSAIETVRAKLDENRQALTTPMQTISAN